MTRKLLQHREALSDDDDSLINLTPLIDVVFVVLITFILVAPILKIDRIQLSDAANTQKENSLPIHERNSIIIRVFDDNSVTVNNRVVMPNELQQVLVTLKKNHPGEHPKLFHDKAAPFGTYQSIKNSVEEVGFEEMDVILN